MGTMPDEKNRTNVEFIERERCVAVGERIYNEGREQGMEKGRMEVARDVLLSGLM